MTSTAQRPRRRLILSARGRKLAGVCGGLADYFDTDVTFVRLIFLVLAAFGGGGVIVYLLAWIVMPAAPSTDDMLGQLQKLGELKQAEVLTEAEFQVQKARILAG